MRIGGEGDKIWWKKSLLSAGLVAPVSQGSLA